MVDPNTLHPIDNGAHTVFLKPLLATKNYTNISVGDFSYYSTFATPPQDGVLPATSFFENNVRYNYGRREASLEDRKLLRDCPWRGVCNGGRQPRNVGAKHLSVSGFWRRMG